MVNVWWLHSYVFKGSGAGVLPSQILPYYLRIQAHAAPLHTRSGPLGSHEEAARLVLLHSYCRWENCGSENNLPKHTHSGRGRLNSGTVSYLGGSVREALPLIPSWLIGMCARTHGVVEKERGNMPILPSFIRKSGFPGWL